MEPQMFFRGLRFWHLCIISLLEPRGFQTFYPTSPQKTKGLRDAVQTFQGEQLGSKMLLPLNDKQQGASRAP